MFFFFLIFMKLTGNFLPLIGSLTWWITRQKGLTRFFLIRLQKLYMFLHIMAWRKQLSCSITCSYKHNLTSHLLQSKRVFECPTMAFCAILSIYLKKRDFSSIYERCARIKKKTNTMYIKGWSPKCVFGINVSTVLAVRLDFNFGIAEQWWMGFLILHIIQWIM